MHDSITGDPPSSPRSVAGPPSSHCQLLAVALKIGGATVAIGSSTLKNSAPQDTSGIDGPPATTRGSRVTGSRTTRRPPARKVVAVGHAIVTSVGTPQPAVAVAVTAVTSLTPQTVQAVVMLNWCGKNARLELLWRGKRIRVQLLHMWLYIAMACKMTPVQGEASPVVCVACCGPAECNQVFFTVHEKQCAVPSLESPSSLPFLFSL